MLGTVHGDVEPWHISAEVAEAHATFCTVVGVTVMNHHGGNHHGGNLDFITGAIL